MPGPTLERTGNELFQKARRLDEARNRQERGRKGGQRTAEKQADATKQQWAKYESEYARQLREGAADHVAVLRVKKMMVRDEFKGTRGAFPSDRTIRRHLLPPSK